MRRWNGWGDDSVRLALPETALALLGQRVGTPLPMCDAPLEHVIAGAQPARLPEHPLIDVSAETRVRHARGQSLPDWLALRYARLGRLPDGVAWPESSEDVRELLALAARCGARVIPYGGGTSVAGHLTPPDDAAPVLTVSLARMRLLHELGPESRLATFGAGVNGPDLEAQLRVHGYTLGHYPQSFDYSTLGGWIATRSSGQQSLRYGRIEQLFAGGSVETPRGTLRVKTVPASAAGIDLRELLLGSEGRIGIITEAAVRIRPLPEHESFHAWFFPEWESGEMATRQAVQDALPLSMLRLSNAEETRTTLQLAGGGRLVATLERYLALRGARQRKVLLIAGVSGGHRTCRATLAELRRLCRRHGAVYAGSGIGERWRAQRFRGVYLRNTLWEHGYAVETVETAVDWPRVRSTMAAVEAAARGAFADGRIHAYAHLSHVYPQGASVYSTFIYALEPDFEANLERWRALKRAVSEAIVACGGTISHQHGVGTDHAPYLAAEKGRLGIEAMRALFRSFDPDGIMNPGKLC
ncbi:FAD-binding oxidoreductase [bacterium]|nr:MAG: FAD-binding oxidoreductase [bacterium]